MNYPVCIIVDDHEALRSLLLDWLGVSFPKFQFLTAASGEEALEMAQKIHPEAMLLDVGLPGMNGIEVTRRVKKNSPGTYIIIHTIHDDLAFREDAARAGADCYIIKSKTQSELLPVIFSALSNIQPENDQAGDL